jgi:acetyl esterase/lipase
MAQFQRHFVQELTKPLIVRQCGDLGFTGDNLSDVISVDLYTDGEPYSGGGDCAGACICPDGSTVALTGSVSGKTASVTLTEDCFAIPGQIGIAIRVTSGTTKTTVLKAIYNVEQFATNNPVDPGSRIALDVGDLINRIDAAVESIPASADQLKAAMAPNFSSTTAYPAGAYVWNNGTLYRFTTDHAAGSWTGTPPTDAIAVALGNDADVLKSAFNQINADVLKISNKNLLNYSDFTDASDVSYTVDSSTGKITITTTTAVHYACLQTPVTYIQNNLRIGEKYRLHIKADSITGATTIVIAVRGVKNNAGGVTKKLTISSGLDGYIDFVADQYMRRITVFMSYGKSALNSVAVIGDIWLERVADSLAITAQQEKSLSGLGYLVNEGNIFEGVYDGNANIIQTDGWKCTKPVYTGKNTPVQIKLNDGYELIICSTTYENGVLTHVSNETTVTESGKYYCPSDYTVFKICRGNISNSTYQSYTDVELFENVTVNIITDINKNDWYDIDIPLESGDLDSSQSSYAVPEMYQTTKSRSKYPLYLNGSRNILLNAIDCKIYVFFMDATGLFLETYYTYNSITENEHIVVPENAIYMQISLNRPIGEGDSYKIGIMINNEKPYFSKRLNTNNSNTYIIGYDIENTNIYSYISFQLPPNYSATGHKVPIIIWIGGTGQYKNMTNGFSVTITKGLHYLVCEGYAVLQVFSLGSYYWKKYPEAAYDQPYPIPTTEKVIESGIKYFGDRYNVDTDNICVIGESMGGIMGYYYAVHPLPGMKAVTLFDPCIDTLSMRGRFSDSRKMLAEDLHFNGTAEELADFYDIKTDGSTDTGVNNNYFSQRCEATWNRNIDSLIRINPAWYGLIDNTYTDKYNDSLADARIWWRSLADGGRYNADDVYINTNYKMLGLLPLKIVGAMDDSDTPHQIMLEKIQQLRNAGTPAEVHLVANGGHGAASFSDNTPWVQTITTALNIECENVQIGWIEAVEWFRRHAFNKAE